MLALIWETYSSLQLFALLFMTMISAIYLLTFKPFAEPLLQNLEVFNEGTSIVLLCITMLFTEYARGDEDRANASLMFNSMMLLNITVHLFFLVRSVYYDCKLKQKRRRNIKLAKQRNALPKPPS